MGHYASEMQSEGSVERAWRIRKEELYNKVKNMSLGCFGVNELRALMDIMGLSRHGFSVNAQDVKMLEEAVARNEKLLRTLPAKGKQHSS